MIISLTGFMGCGKSSVGKVLSELLCLPFVDLDEFIREREGRSIEAIFADGGEAAFRVAELAALRVLLDSEDDFVLALGGGTLTAPEAAELVREHTFCVYLRATLESLESWIGSPQGRPMLGLAGIAELLEARLPQYEAAADLVLDVDDLLYEDTAAAIAAAVSAE